MARANLLRLIVFATLVLLAITCAILLFGTHRGRFLMHHPRRIVEIVHAHRLLIFLAFVAVYILIGMLAMPVWWLQILAGYAFPLRSAIVAPQISSTITSVTT